MVHAGGEHGHRRDEWRQRDQHHAEVSAGHAPTQILFGPGAHGVHFQNFNVQVDFGGAEDKSGSIRALTGKAEQNRVNSYADIDLSNGAQSGLTSNYYPTGTAIPYPNGYAGFPQITADYTGKHVSFSGIPAIVGDINAYSIGALSSTTTSIGILISPRCASIRHTSSMMHGRWTRACRFSSRDTKNLSYDYLAPFYAAQSSNGTGCLVKWKATDVVLNGGGIAGACSAGDAASGTMQYYSALPGVPLSTFGSDVIRVTDFGGVSGVPAIYSLDPAAMDDPKAFHDALFPGNVKVANPGSSYGWTSISRRPICRDGMTGKANSMRILACGW